MITATAQLTIETEITGRTALVRVAGRIDRASAGRLSHCLRSLVNRRAKIIVLDLGQVRAADSRGAAETGFAMLHCERQNVAVFPCRPPAFLRELFEVSRMIPPERVIDHEDEALGRGFDRPAGVQQPARSDSSGRDTAAAN